MAVTNGFLDFIFEPLEFIMESFLFGELLDFVLLEGIRLFTQSQVDIFHRGGEVGEARRDRLLLGLDILVGIGEGLLDLLSRLCSC